MVNWRMRMRSKSQLAGCAAALTVGMLWLLGVVTEYVPLVALVSYATGVAAFWSSATVVVPSKLDVLAQIRWLKVKAQPLLDGEARLLLSRILEHIEEMLPRLAEMKSQGLLVVEQRTTLRQTVTTLLPNALNPYLRLPTRFARTRVLDNGKTAQQEMTEQLRTLERHLYRMREATFDRDVNALLLSGLVLEERFRQVELLSKPTSGL